MIFLKSTFFFFFTKKSYCDTGNVSVYLNIAKKKPDENCSEMKINSEENFIFKKEWTN